MDKNDKERLTHHIINEIEVLKNDVSAYKVLARPVSPDNAIGRLTRMEAINSKSINEAALRKAKERLLRLEMVLKTIEIPDFGLCKVCEEPIPFARLMAVPDAALCIGCAEEANG